MAHLTDLHLDGDTDRRDRFLHALTSARYADHLVLSGDLTDRGVLSAFEELSDCLDDAWIGKATIVPGNHDLDLHRWENVLTRTSLGRFASTSWPGSVHPVGDAFVVAGNTQNHRRALIFRATGRIDPKSINAVLALPVDRVVIWAMHHPPLFAWSHPLTGLTNMSVVRSVMARRPLVHVLSGHDHERIDRGNVHVASSCGFDDRPLRFYEVSRYDLEPL